MHRLHKTALFIFLLVAACFFENFFTSAYGNEQPEETIVLTFDDGPRKEVLAGPDGLLALLSKEHIHATFFVQGWQAVAQAELTREVSKQGHTVANHTHGHATPREWARIRAHKDRKSWAALNGGEKLSYLAKGRKVFLADTERGRKAIQALVGYAPLFLRPPKWDIDQELYCELSRTHIVQMISGVVDTSRCVFRPGVIPYPDINTTDYEIIRRYVHGNMSHDAAVRAVVERAHGRYLYLRREKPELNTLVFVFHEHRIVVEALRILIPEWKKRGIHFATLAEVYGL